MGLQVVGAGLGRTGTNSLKVALETLLGGPCYHMVEVFGRPGDDEVWADAYEGRPPRWADFLADFRATVDWPACSFYRELSDAFPDALVLLSTRDADGWWTSASNTIFVAIGTTDDPGRMVRNMIGAFTPDLTDESAVKAAYLAHNQQVRDTVPSDRLLEWHPGDGWEPICAALDLDVPDQPFPHVNTTEQFRRFAGIDPAPTD